MVSNYDAARLDALAAEIGLLNGPFETWCHLPLKSVSGDLPATDVDVDDDGADSNRAEEDEEVVEVGETEMDDEEEAEDEEENADEDEDSNEDDYDEDEGYDEDDAQEQPLDKHEMKETILRRILQDLGSLVQKSEGCSDFEQLVSNVEKLMDKAATKWCSSIMSALDFSFAHSAERPELDGAVGKGVGNGTAEAAYSYASFMARMMNEEVPQPLTFEDTTRKTPPWAETFRPHPLSTKFARFKDSVDVTPTHDQPIANAIYTARCEISETAISYPASMDMSPDAEIIIRTYTTGYKNRTSALRYHLLDHVGLAVPGHIPRPKGVKGTDTGLSDHVHQITFDDSRKLFFAADWDRIKSFRWGPIDVERDGTEPYGEGLPVHTFKSGDWSGPLATISSGEGRLVRAGKGSAGVWNLDTAPTHGENGRARIGDKFNTENTWRDDPEHIEKSGGSPADSTVTFEDSSFTPKIWRAHPSQPGVMLSGSDHDATKSFAFVGIDLENGGKWTERYLGHGGDVLQISTAEGQPHSFVTACMDGFVRLWDTRIALPALTLRVGRGEGCTAVAYANPDGIPTIFTGAGSEEHIKLWDVRARTPVYKLATGNNAVNSLAWDHKRNNLWAATAAESKQHGYRRSNIPPGQEGQYDEYRRWPTRAYHWEDYFGHLYNANKSTLFRYSFKEEPDTTILPEEEL